MQSYHSLVGCQESDVATARAHDNRVVFTFASNRKGGICAPSSSAPMHLLYISRSRQLLQGLYSQLNDILDPRIHPTMYSTASAPSLRAAVADPYPMMAASPASDDPGNVKVVVRCRAFLKRGKPWRLQLSAIILTVDRER